MNQIGLRKSIRIEVLTRKFSLDISLAVSLDVRDFRINCISRVGSVLLYKYP